MKANGSTHSKSSESIWISVQVRRPSRSQHVLQSWHSSYRNYKRYITGVCNHLECKSTLRNSRRRMIDCYCSILDGKHTPLCIVYSITSSTFLMLTHRIIFPQIQLTPTQGQAEIVLHQTWLYEHHDFLIAPQHHIATQALPDLTYKI